MLLRVTLAVGLFVDAANRLPGLMRSQIASALCEALAGVLLFLGLWTPVASLAACVLMLGPVMLLQRNAAQVLLSIIALSLALLGPGAWSIDARLFGRRRVDIGQFRDD